MKMKHTPGPWLPRYTPGRAFGAEDVWCIDWSHDQQEVAEIVHGESNASLIASAPELLEALKELAQSIVWKEFGECRGFTEEMPLPIITAVEKARKAIAKATGEHQ